MIKNEYLVDRLRGDIVRLEREIADLDQRHGEVLVAEIILAVICFFLGFLIGAGMS